MFSNADALQITLRFADNNMLTGTNILYNVGTKLLNGKCANVSSKLANNSVAEAVVV
jgi:hypothetical protein